MRIKSFYYVNSLLKIELFYSSKLGFENILIFKLCLPPSLSFSLKQQTQVIFLVLYLLYSQFEDA